MKILTRHEEHVLLTILHLGDNAYLVTIREHLKELTGKDQSFGTLYVLLRRLEKAGYINHRVGEATAKRGGKAIKYYTVTEYGIETLTEIQKVQVSMWLNFSEFAYKK
ncbi:PadR family transcriptional regulator [candidate division KSB1 bacterium]